MNTNCYTSRVSLARRADQNPTRATRTRAWVGRWLFPQWLRTFIITLFWLAFSGLWAAAVAPAEAGTSALAAAVGLGLFAAIGSHVWPTRTSPWRTVAWVGVVTLAIGANFQYMQLGRVGFTATVLVGVLIAILRVNQNGRKLVRLFRAIRTSR